MPNHSSTLLGKYSFFASRMDPAVSLDGDDLLGGVVARPHHLSYYVALACVLLGAWWFKSRQEARKRRVDVPFHKASLWKWIFDAESQVMHSYKRFYGQVYQIKATEGMQVLIPPSMVGELKGLPEETLSATAAVSEAMMSEYTHFHLGNNQDLMSTLVRTKLTHHLSSIVTKLKEEVEYIFSTEFAECRDWTTVKIQPFTLRAVARMGGRIFVGPDINRNEEWVSTNVEFVVHVFMAVVKLQFIPAPLRPFLYRLVPDVGRIRADIDRARRLLAPIIDERLRDMENSPGYEPPDDLISWLLQSMPAEERGDAALQAQMQLVLSTASIHTTNNLVVDCLYDLAENLDVQEELRREVEEVFSEAVEGGRGEWTKESLTKMKKLDSLMKEVQRLRGNITGFIRKVIKPIDLSDGTHLPAGTKLLVPQAGISHDAMYYTSPDEFDAMRFYNLRQQGSPGVDGGSGGAEGANRHQFTSISDTNVNFGLGKHACPGRFFAGNEIKMLLAYFLTEYDIRLKPGEARPKGIAVMMSKVPNPDGEIQFKKRERVL